MLLFFCSLFFLHSFLIIFASLSFDFVSFFVQAEEFAVVFDVFLGESAASVQLASCINKKQFLWLLISDVSDDKVFDDL